MKICTRCGEGKDRSLFSRRARSPDGLQPACKTCVAEYDAAYRARNKEQIAARKRNWKRANSEHVRAKEQEYRAVRPELERERQRRCKEKDPERFARRAAGRTRRYTKRHPEKNLAAAARRRAAKLRASPSWADRELVAEFYHLARLRTRLTGIRWHVDHIVPLRGDTVSGLHVEHNLQVIPARMNLAKGNRSWPS